MTARYQNEHYEDVAKLLGGYTYCEDGSCESCDSQRVMVGRFADLFAADNSQQCLYCLTSGPKPVGEACPQRGLAPANANTYHSFAGFDRERFLAACGLK